jgi:hypothetical protein
VTPLDIAPATTGVVATDVEPPAPAPEKLHIDFDERTLVIDDVAFARPWRLAALKRVLGAPRRVFHLANELHVYDDQGVVVYERPNTGVVTALSIFYAPKDFEFMPAKTFRGTLRLGGVPVDEHTTKSEIRERVPFPWQPDGSRVQVARFSGLSVIIDRAVETYAVEVIALGLDE